MRVNHQSTDKATSLSTAGFTLLELTIVVVVVGLLSAIAVPAWLSFVERQRLNTAQNQVYQALQSARSNAKRDKLTWKTSLREQLINGKPIVQWAVHPASVIPTEEIWQNLESGIHLDPETNLNQVLFNYQGCPVSKSQHECTQTSITTQGRITLYSKHGGKTKRCVIVSTLLGAIRTAHERSKADDKGRYCY